MRAWSRQFSPLAKAVGAAALLCSGSSTGASAWNNGPSGNARTDEAGECASPPYATHDWIADHALALLPAAERAWLEPHKALYLLGTEAPDNPNIHADCNGPNTGYGDTGAGHSVEWESDGSGFVEGRDRAAFRAQQEYHKAVTAYLRGDLNEAAYYLGAMAHYVGDAAQFGHTYPDEANHSNYERWAASRTDSFNEGHFEGSLVASSLVRRRPYTAVKRISKAVFFGRGDILPAPTMDAKYRNERDQAFLDSAGAALNVGVNELADVLHTFFLNVVQEDA